MYFGIPRTHLPGADPGFQVRGGGAHLKKLRGAEGGTKIFGVFRVKNHDFTPTNLIFSDCGGRRENFWGISCEKSRFYAKKSNFFPLDPPLLTTIVSVSGEFQNTSPIFVIIHVGQKISWRCLLSVIHQFVSGYEWYWCWKNISIRI